jgi:hypothetical protein
MLYPFELMANASLSSE